MNSVQLVNKGMPRILNELNLLARHLRFLSEISASKGMEPRDLLRCVNDAKRSAIELKHDLTQLATLQATVRRRDLGDRYGLFAANYRGVLKKISAAFVRVEREWAALERKVQSRLNEPGRWGDAAASGPVADLVGLIGQILELWGLLRVKRKLEA